MMKRIIFIVLIATTSTAQAQKFSALTPLSGGLATTDLMAVAEDIGGPPYQTRSFTGTDLVNFMNANISGGGIYSGSGSLSGTTEVTQGANKLEFTVSVLDGFSVAGNTFSVDGANSRVGIGTTVPTEQLHVSGGDLRVDGKIGINQDHTGGVPTNGDLIIKGSGANLISFINSGGTGIGRVRADGVHDIGHYFLTGGGELMVLNAEFANPKLVWRTEAGGFKAALGHVTVAAQTFTNSIIDDFVIRSARDILFGNGTTESMTLTSAGNLGIGANVPTSTLDVTGTMAVSDDANFDSGTLQIDAGTNFVGLGTTKTSVFSFEYRASAATDGMFIRNAAGNSRVVLGYDPNGSRLFMYNNSNVADFGYISNKVGLGFDISNPALILAKLHVQGDDDLAGTLGLLVENNSAADNFKVQNDGVCVFRSFTVATLPSASTAGGFIFVSDETGGAVMAFSDGTNWRRVTDRAIVS